MSGPPRRGAGPGLAALLVVAALFAWTQHPGVLAVPFVGDDYFFLGKTRGASFLSLWEPRELVSSFYRPWSRELHYWVLQHLCGDRVACWHAASLLLWVGVMGTYFALARRLAGPRVAMLAGAGVMTLAGWGTVLVWAAGAQDLWMMLFALLALHAVWRERPGWACAAQSLALLSKETGALLPVAAYGIEWLVRRQRPAAALRRVLPMLVLTLAWAALHPLLGGRLWWPRHDAVLPGLHPPFVLVAARTLLTVLNLHAWPAPEAGWAAALRLATPGALALTALLAWGTWRGREGPAAASRARLVVFGALWALLGWLPMLLPSVGWHAYYALFGAMGAWLALAVGLARAPRAAWLVVAALVVLRAAQATTPSQDWGTEWFQRRAAAFSEETRAALLRLRPSLPAGSRVFLSGAPGGAGLLPGGEESPPLRWWYRDPGLRAGAWERYRPRAAADSLGQDVFLRYDRAAGWREVVSGAGPVGMPTWREDHERLAVALSRGGDWAGAFTQYAGLARGYPDEPTYPYYAGLACIVIGDSAQGGRWVRAAAALPAADEEIRTAARRMEGGR